jgi:hypothetical protein
MKKQKKALKKEKLRKQLRPGEQDISQDNIRIDTFEDEVYEEQKKDRSPLVTYGCPFIFLLLLVIIIIVSTVALVPRGV